MTRLDESRLKLMVVDDEPDNLDLLYRTFRKDFQVFKANHARSALNILDKEGEMAVIISDQRMPEMNGTEFLSRTVERFPDTIRILLTGYTDVEDLVDAINSGQVFKYITKPWNPDNLKAVVQQAADTYRVLKQRTNQLLRALRRERLVNAVMTAIRESIDYHSMLQKIVETIGQTFEASCLLRPVESERLMPEAFCYQAANTPAICNSHHDSLIQAVLESRKPLQSQGTENDYSYQKLVVPLTYQQDMLAVLALYQSGTEPPWPSVEEIQLIEGVAEQAALALSQAKLYQRLQEQAQQIRAELEVARQIQHNLLRQSWPNIDGVRMQACCFPAREVGGDFFEVYVHPRGDIWLAVGDVSGKGVPAALFMASAISVLRRELAQEAPPEPNIVMQNLNHSLSDDLIGNNCFITLVLARYTPATKTLTYANAGHIYPLVWSRSLVAAHLSEPNSPAVEPTYLHVRGIPLGILPVWQAAAGSLTLAPEDTLLLTSDGITEATVCQETAFSGDLATGGEQTSRSMLKQAGLWQLLLQEPQPLNLTNLLARIQGHNEVQEDDQTILSLEVL